MSVMLHMILKMDIKLYIWYALTYIKIYIEKTRNNFGKNVIFEWWHLVKVVISDEYIFLIYKIIFNFY